jgi:hypothetical protein
MASVTSRSSGNLVLQPARPAARRAPAAPVRAAPRGSARARAERLGFFDAHAQAGTALARVGPARRLERPARNHAPVSLLAARRGQAAARTRRRLAHGQVRGPVSLRPRRSRAAAGLPPQGRAAGAPPRRARKHRVGLGLGRRACRGRVEEEVRLAGRAGARAGEHGSDGRHRRACREARASAAAGARRSGSALARPVDEPASLADPLSNVCELEFAGTRNTHLPFGWLSLDTRPWAQHTAEKNSKYSTGC